MEGLWPDQVDAAESCGVVLGDHAADPTARNSDLAHVIQAFLQAAATSFADVPAYFYRMKNALVEHVARHGSGDSSEFLTPEQANTWASQHGCKATVMLAAAFAFSSNIVFATGGEHMMAEPTLSPSQFGESANPEFTRVRFSQHSFCNPVHSSQNTPVESAAPLARLCRPTVPCATPLPNEIAVLLTDATADFPNDVYADELRKGLRSLILGDCASDWSQACLSFFHTNVGIVEEDNSTMGPGELQPLGSGTAATDSSERAGLGYNSVHSWAAQTQETICMAAPCAVYDISTAARVDSNEPVPPCGREPSPSYVFTPACQ